MSKKLFSNHLKLSNHQSDEAAPRKKRKDKQAKKAMRQEQLKSAANNTPKALQIKAHRKKHTKKAHGRVRSVERHPKKRSKRGS
jgi:hypothetical protein